MEILEFLRDIVLLLVVLAVALLITNRESIADISRNLTGEFIIAPRGVNPLITKSLDANGNINGYNVIFNAKLAYINPESIHDSFLKDTDDDGIDDSIEVVPIVTFKGGGTQGEVFTLNKKNMEENKQDHQFPPRADYPAIFIRTNEPPIEKTDVSILQQEVKEKDGFVMKSDENGDFLVKLEQYEEEIDFAALKSNPLSPRICKIAFRIQCGDDIKPLYIQEDKDCIESSCSDNLAICNGVVQIQMNEKPDCRERKNIMTISVKGGIEKGLGEEISISFWRNHQCIKDETYYRRLTALCGLQRFSGLYIYNISLIDSLIA